MRAAFLTLVCLSVLGYVTADAFFRSCYKTQDCESDKYVCTPDRLCVHRTLNPLTRSRTKTDAEADEDAYEMNGFGLIIFIAAFAQPVGNGGGALLIPIMVVIFGFFNHEAVANAKLCIFGGAVANYALNAFRRNPRIRALALVDYTTASILAPLVLMGHEIGNLLNMMLPMSAVYILMTVVLLVLTRDVVTRTFKLYYRETQAKLIAQTGNDTSRSGGDEQESYVAVSKEVEMAARQASLDAPPQNAATGEGEVIALPPDIASRVIESRFPIQKILLIVSIFGFYIVIWLFRGSREFDSFFGVEKCGFKWWILTILTIPLSILMTCVAKRLAQNEEIENPALPKDAFLWSKLRPGTIVRFLFFSLIGGVLSGTIGDGGGLVYAPLFLQMGFAPEVATSTSGLIIMFSSFSYATEYFLRGAYHTPDVLFLIAICAAGAIVGNISVFTCMKKFERSSIILLYLSVLMLASAVTVPVYGWFHVFERKFEFGELFKLHSPCEAGH